MPNPYARYVNAENPYAAYARRNEPGRMSSLQAFGSGAADSITFGFGDEALGVGAGALDALQGGDFEATRDRVTAESRRRRALAEDQEGGAFLAGQIGGALVGGLGIGAAARGGLRAIPALANAARGTNWAGRLALASGSAGAGGALYGAGSGDAGNRAESALAYGLPAAAGGAVLSGAGMLIGPHLSNAWRGVRPNAAAADVLGQAITREGGEDVIRQRLAEHAAMGRGGTMLDALQESGSHVAMGAAVRPSTGRRVLQDALNARQEQVGPRAQQEIWQELVGSEPEDVAQFVLRMDRVKRTEAGPLYAQAWQEIGRVDPARMQATLGETMRRHPDIFEPALQRAQRMALAETGQEIADQSDPRYWHYLLQGAERELGARLRAASMGDLRGFAGSEAAIYSRAVNNFNRQVRAALGPTFRRAQDTYAGAAAAQDAAELGYAAVTGNLNTLQIGAAMQRFSRMSQPEQQAFRAAAANRLQDIVANATRRGENRADVLRSIVGTEGKRRVLERIFGQRGINELLRRFDYDRRILQNSVNTGIRVNSITAPAQAAAAAQQAAAGIPSTPGGIVNRLLGPQLQRAAERQNEAVSDRVLTLLATPADDALAMMAQPPRRGLLSRAAQTAPQRLLYDSRARAQDVAEMRERDFLNALFGGLYSGVGSQGATSYIGGGQ